MITDPTIKDDSKYNIATYKNFGSNEIPIDIAYLDIFNYQSAYDVLNSAFSNMKKTIIPNFDGIYLRGNTPFSNKDGSVKTENKIINKNDKFS